MGAEARGISQAEMVVVDRMHAHAYSKVADVTRTGGFKAAEALQIVSLRSPYVWDSAVRKRYFQFRDLERGGCTVPLGLQGEPVIT